MNYVFPSSRFPFFSGDAGRNLVSFRVGDDSESDFKSRLRGSGDLKMNRRHARFAHGQFVRRFRAECRNDDALVLHRFWIVEGRFAKRRMFAALDTDGDGKVTPQEMAAGLGGAFMLAKT